MKRCACGVRTYNADGVCAICRMKAGRRAVDQRGGGSRPDRISIGALTGGLEAETPSPQPSPDGRGSEKKEEEIMAANTHPNCKHPGCEKIRVREGLCTAHYKEAHGLPVGRQKKGAARPFPRPAGEGKGGGRPPINTYSLWT